MGLRIYGNRPLKTLPGLETRPTLARVREAVFNIWQNQITGCRWLDLCSGWALHVAGQCDSVEGLAGPASKMNRIYLHSTHVELLKNALERWFGCMHCAPLCCLGWV